jgi:transposase-like protein
VTWSSGSAGSRVGKYDLGVLFVHGIGEQQQYSTLARFGGALQRWLRQWQDGRRGDRPESDRVAPPPSVDVRVVDAHPGDPKVPAHAEVEVKPGCVLPISLFLPA